MTIAVGLRCQDGVLLCADTEHTGYSAKSHHAKLERFDISGGNICFALAGASALAWTAVQKCKTELQAPSADVIGHIEEILDREYRRNVLGHPNYSRLDYQLLLGVWLTGKRPRLFCTTTTAMTEVQDFECIGIGAELAAYLIRPGFPVSSFHDALRPSANPRCRLAFRINQPKWTWSRHPVELKSRFSPSFQTTGCRYYVNVESRTNVLQFHTQPPNDTSRFAVLVKLP